VPKCFEETTTQVNRKVGNSTPAIHKRLNR